MGGVGSLATPQLGGSLFSSATPPAGGANLLGLGAAQPAQAQAPPTLSSAPFGSLPVVPQVTSVAPSAGADVAPGISHRTPTGTYGGVTPSARVLARTPRTITPRSSLRVRPSRIGTPGGTPGEPTPDEPVPLQHVAAREDPRRLFVKSVITTRGAAEGDSDGVALGPEIGAAPASSPALDKAAAPMDSPLPTSTPELQPHDVLVSPSPADLGPMLPSSDAELTPQQRALVDQNPQIFRPVVKRHGASSNGPGASSPTSAGDGRRLSSTPSLLPTLTNQEYFTSPSLHDLATLSRARPSALETVENFTVGRRNHGKVRWLDATDVRGLDLDAIVKFDKDSVSVYLTGGVSKPPQGKGLNKRAEVTIYNVHKRDKTTGLIETDPQKIKKFQRKLEAKQDTRFVSYNPSGGVWVFEVDHFSRWGLDPDDMEDSDDEGQDGDGDDAMDQGGPGIAQLVSPETLDPYVEGPSEFASVPPPPQQQSLAFSLPSVLGLPAAEMQAAREAYFPVPEAPARQQQQRPARQVDVPGASSGEAAEQMLQAFSAPPSGTSLELTSLGLQAQRSTALAIAQTPHAARPAAAVDAALAMGRSFRVGWGPGGVLVHSGSVRSSGSNAKLMRYRHGVVVEVVSTVVSVEVPAEKVRAHLAHALDVSGAHTDIVVDVDAADGGVPEQRFECDRVKLPTVCNNYLEGILNAIPSEEDADALTTLPWFQLCQERSVWDLVNVLFAKGADDEGPLERHRRRAGVSDWLRAQCARGVQSDLMPEDTVWSALVLLTGHQIEKATAAAVDGGDPRLATLIAQSGAGIDCVEHVQGQLQLWEAHGFLSRVSQGRQALHTLLAGNVEGAKAALPAPVEWHRSVGLHMWHGQSPASPLSEVLDAFERESADGLTPAPVPLYVQEKIFPTGPPPADVLDLNYALLRIFSGAEMEPVRVLHPSCVTPDPLDHSMSWHVAQVLSSIGVLDVPPALEAALHVGFAAQLTMQGGMVGPAIYALCHLRDPATRAAAVRELLGRHCPEWAGDRGAETYFVETLGIPQVWLDDAKATHAGYYGDGGSGASRLAHSCAARRWNKAHEVLMREVVPQLYLSGQNAALQQNVAALAVHHIEIEGWALGGGLLRDVLALHSHGHALVPDERGSSEVRERVAELRTRARAAAAKAGDGPLGAVLSAVAISDAMQYTGEARTTCAPCALGADARAQATAVGAESLSAWLARAA